MKFKTRFRKNYDRREPNADYLKYWKVVKQWARARYDLGTADIEMMLFLYSEGLFTKFQFEEFNEIMSWDKNRFHKMLKDEWIIKWRERKGRESTLYELGFKGKRVCWLPYWPCGQCRVLCRFRLLPYAQSASPRGGLAIGTKSSGYHVRIWSVPKRIRE